MTANRQPAISHIAQAQHIILIWPRHYLLAFGHALAEAKK
jgi:hypothetical protein